MAKGIDHGVFIVGPGEGSQPYRMLRRFTHRGRMPDEGMESERTAAYRHQYSTGEDGLLAALRRVNDPIFDRDKTKAAT